MKSGTIAKITDKGYGFIQPQDGGEDVFFHITGLKDREIFNSINEGDKVTYELDTGHDRPRAINVVVV